ncbi:MAG: DegV family protein [Acutalibacter sp.]|nr:DegV family protein [Acutalibacter sp.]
MSDPYGRPDIWYRKNEYASHCKRRRVEVFDSLAASMGEGLLVYLAAQQQKAGLTLDQLLEWLKENVLHLCHWFTVDDLNHLKRGGRVSAATALVGTMLGIKPVLHVDDEGHLIPVSKVRGRKQSLDELVRKMAETALDPAGQTVFISHGDCLADAQYVEKRVRETLGVKKFYINFIGPVIGAHSGPGTVALFFLGQHR